jgi:hypothetical protein
LRNKVKIVSSNNSNIIVLTINDFLRLERINNSIVLIDEVVFAKLMRDDRDKYEKLLRYTTNYYVLISRSQIDLSRIPFSITELYTFETESEYSTELKRFINVTKNVPYVNIPKENNVVVDNIVTEDSSTGLRFFKKVSGLSDNKCISAHGNTGILKVLRKYDSNESILVVVDGVAFGNYIRGLIEYINEHKNVIIYAPESFEWILLHSNIFKGDRKIKLVLNNTSEVIDNIKFPTWEVYYTDILENYYSNQTVDEHLFKYSKQAGLSDVFTNQENINNLQSILPAVSYNAQNNTKDILDEREASQKDETHHFR